VAKRAASATCAESGLSLRGILDEQLARRLPPEEVNSLPEGVPWAILSQTSAATFGTAATHRRRTLKRLRLGWVVLAFVAFLGPSVVHAQKPAEPYQPMTSTQMSQLGLWDAWVTTFNNLTAKQKAEVMRRHVEMCLTTFSVTDEQRALVKSLTAKYASEAMYAETDPQKRQALAASMQPDMERGQQVLGQELFMTFFFAKPPVSVLEAVKNDPAFK
jgi:hypothetical protein